MSLDLRNFVIVNINYNTANVSRVTRGIVTLIATANAYSTDPYKGLVFYSLAEYKKAKTDKGVVDTSLDAYVEAFFGNRGKALQILADNTTNPVPSAEDKIAHVLARLDYNHVIVTSDLGESQFRKAIALAAATTQVANPLSGGTVDTYSGLNEKMFIASTADDSGNLFDALTEAETWAANTFYSKDPTKEKYELLTTQPQDWATNYSSYYKVAGNLTMQNYVVKEGAKGIEMLAAAYLSRVDVTNPSTMQDYAFTIENVTQFFSSSIISDNAIGVRLINANINFDSQLVNATRNFPGNTIHGEDMMNYYIKILITQDLSESIMSLLSSKIRFNQAGLNRVDNAISKTLGVYASDGYLDTEFIWTDEDLHYSYNGNDYVVCARNTPLVKGYKALILPLSSLTSEQREAHAMPPVYVLLADQVGIRAIVINGDVY